MERSELIKGARFVLWFSIFYLALWLFLSTITLYPLKAFSAGSASLLLNGSVDYSADNPIISYDGLQAQITDLCAGDLEIAVLFAVILATFDRSWTRRLWGCAFGFITIMLLNPVRIAIVMSIWSSSGAQSADFTHDVLFRGMLLFVIVFYYFIWYVGYDLLKERMHGKKRKKRRK